VFACSMSFPPYPIAPSLAVNRKEEDMRKRIVLWACVAIVLLPVLGLAGWIATLPSPAAPAAPPPVAEAEHQAMLAALKPPKRNRPVVAIIGINNATETTDY